MKKLILFFLILIGAAFASWTYNSSVTSGLTDVGSYSLPEAFNLSSSTVHLIIGESIATLNGYTWNGTGWQSNSSIISGATSYGTYQLPSVFKIGTTSHMIIGDSSGRFTGRTWNGSTWVANTSIVSGLPDVGSDSSPSVFNMSGQLYLISGEYSPAWNGYRWNGTTWVSNSTIIGGLSTHTSSIPEVYNNTDASRWEMLVGKGTAGEDGYFWNGTAWQNDSSIVSGINTTLTDHAATTFYINGSMKMIHGEALGNLYGYTLVIEHVPPIMQSVEISPASIRTGENAVCTINATDENNATFSVSVGIAENGAINTSYTTTNTSYSSGSSWAKTIKVNSSAGTNASCWANATDGRFTADIMYSSNITIQVATSITACQNITTSESYTIAQNLTATADCIEISIGNVSINLNGKTIIGDGGAADRGIFSIGRDNVTIKNGYVKGFGIGITLTNITNLTAGNLTLENCSSFMYLSSSSVVIGNLSFKQGNASVRWNSVNVSDINATQGTSVQIGEEIASVNISALNLSSNITLYSPECFYRSIMSLSGFPLTAEDIRENGTRSGSHASCTSDIGTFEGSSFSGYALGLTKNITQVKKARFYPRWIVQNNVSAFGQSSTYGVYYVEMGSGEIENVSLSYSPAISGLTIKCAPNWNQSGLMTISQTAINLIELNSTSTQIWCWADFDHTLAQGEFNVTVT